MAKAPAFQFYPDDFLRDTHELSLAAVGAWAKLLCKMHYSVTPGRISWPIVGYARTFGSSVDQAKVVIDEILAFGIADGETERDGKVTLVNRRMVREEEARLAHNNRQSSYRDRKKRDGDAVALCEGDAKVTLLSSSLSSSSSSKKENNNNKGRPFAAFEATEEMKAWAAKVVPNVKIAVEHARFEAYYSTGKGKDRRSEDWVTGWRLWMLNAENRALPKVDRHSPCSECGERRRIVTMTGSYPCPDCRPQEYAAWLKGRDV